MVVDLSFRGAISDRSWEQGVGTFFYEEVPFSFSTGATFAGAIAQFLHTLYAEKEALYIEELGAGIGMLSVHLLKSLECQFPDLFQKTKVHVTEFSDALARELVQTGVFADYLDHVTLGRDDCRKTSGRRPDLVLMTYVFDAIPVRQLCYQGGRWYERVTDVALPETLLWDGSVFPPRSILATDLLATDVSDLPDDVPFGLLRQVWSNLIETDKLIPLDWDSFSAEDRGALAAVSSETSDDHVIRLNWPVGFFSILDSLWDTVSDIGSWLIYDVGSVDESKTVSWSNLQTYYGLTVCSMLSFSLIREWARLRGVCCRCTHHASGNSQIMVLSRQIISESSWGILETVCQTYSYAAYADVLRAIEAHPKSFFETMPAVSISEDMAKVLQISEGMASDYTVIMHAAERCYREGLYVQAKAFLDRALLDYGAVGVNAWLFRGKLCKAMSDYEGAAEAFLRGYCIAPQSEYLLYELGALSLAMKDYRSYIDYAKAYLRYRSELPDVWETVVTIVLCLSLMGRHDEARLACADILAMAESDGAISDSVLGKIKRIQKEIL